MTTQSWPNFPSSSPQRTAWTSSSQMSAPRTRLFQTPADQHTSLQSPGLLRLAKNLSKFPLTNLSKFPPTIPSQPVHQSLPAVAVPSAGCDSTLAAIAASLPVGPTDAYIAALNAPPAEEMEDASDTSSVKSLARAHGYDDAGPCDDAPTQLLSYAMPHCMLCEVSGQPDTITFSHDTDDPYCPSY